MGISGVPSGEMTVSFRSGWVKYLKVAASSAGGAAVVLALFTLLQREPSEGFRLLAAWGPWPFVALVGLTIAGKFLSRMNDTVQGAFGAVVTTVQGGVDAQNKTADALTRLADQGNRRQEEIERLAVYAAQEFPLVHQRLDRQDEALRSIQEAVTGGERSR